MQTVKQGSNKNARFIFPSIKRSQAEFEYISENSASTPTNNFTIIDNI